MMSQSNTLWPSFHFCIPLLVAVSLGGAALPAYGQPVPSSDTGSSQVSVLDENFPGQGWGIRLGVQNHYRKIA
ncbi:MAG TPA: hypothetical protein VL002_02960, partial [Candidimonas sp.]|nr:hypothetical protein [Candidimonas sp.]